jgi:UDP-N-acetylglucosamine acyltransferase
MNRIHPTAIVDPQAQLGENVTIGPYCVVEAGVVLGDDCWLQHHVTICGPTRIGKSNRFRAFSSIGQQTQDLKYTGEPTYLEIGDGNSFREFVTINRATAINQATKIGSECNFLAYSHVAHDCVVRDGVIFSNNGTVGGHVLVEEHAVLGGLCGVHQFCRIGAYAITGGCTKIVQDVPPFMIADGNPAAIRGVNVVGMERHGYSGEVIRVMREAYRILYRANLNTKQAVAELERSFPESPEVRKLAEFVLNSERGIVR